MEWSWILNVFSFSIFIMGRFYFTDYIQVWWMQLRGDVVCMEGAYVDVVTGRLTSSYFEAGFDAFYGLVAGLDWCRNDRLVDFLIKLVDSGDPEASVTFYDDIEVLIRV